MFFGDGEVEDDWHKNGPQYFCLWSLAFIGGEGVPYSSGRPGPALAHPH